VLTPDWLSYLRDHTEWQIEVRWRRGGRRRASLSRGRLVGPSGRRTTIVDESNTQPAMI
jgi:hypothetical protein